MHDAAVQGTGRRREALVALLLCAGAVGGGCVSDSYAGIPLEAGAADPTLQVLARRAQAGDKHAQLELGIRFEEGHGVPINLERAKSLYRAAAADSGETQLVYIPASRGGGRASTVPFSEGLRSRGLPEAKRRLKVLMNSRLRNDSSSSTSTLGQSICTAFALASTVACEGSSAPVTRRDNSTEAPLMTDLPDLQRYGIMVPPNLRAEAAQGIQDCFLSSEVMDGIKARGLSLIKCDSNSAVAIARDTVGIVSKTRIPERQPLVLSVLHISHGERLLSELRTISRDEMDRSSERIIRARFQVPEESGNLEFWAMITPLGEFIGDVVISRSKDQKCMFSYFDNELPQTICYARTGEYILKLQTNSTSYGAVQDVMNDLLSIDWS